MKKSVILRIISALTALALVLCLAGCKKKNEPTETQPDNFAADESQANAEYFVMTTPSGIGLHNFFAYSGPFVEDGSDEQVTNVAAITVKNTSETYFQTVKLFVNNGEKDYNFFITSFFPGDVVTVLETDRQQFDPDKPVASFGVSESGEFPTAPSLHKDKFVPQIFDGIMNVQNIADRDFKYNVYFYYKNVNETGYLGGITYRVDMGAMKKGAISQGSSSHLSESNSKIIFVTYGE